MLRVTANKLDSAWLADIQARSVRHRASGLMFRFNPDRDEPGAWDGTADLDTVRAIPPADLPRLAREAGDAWRAALRNARAVR